MSSKNVKHLDEEEIKPLMAQINPDNSIIIPTPPSVEWYKHDTLAFIFYVILCVLSIGILPIIALFDPPVGIRGRCIKCLADESEIAIVRLCDKEGLFKEYVSITERKNNSTNEKLVALEANCLRFIASSLDEFELRHVPEIPHNFVRFLYPNPRYYCKNIEEINNERSLLLLQYGLNTMSIPETNVIEITAKHALNPVILFGYL